MLQQGDYYLVQTANSPLKAVSLDPDTNFYFRLVSNSDGLFMLFYDFVTVENGKITGKGKRRLVLQNINSDKAIVNVKETLAAGDIDTFRIYSPAGNDKYLLQRGEFFIGVGADFGLITGKKSEVTANPDQFLFTIKLAEEVLAAIGGQIETDLALLEATFAQQVEDARKATRAALEAQMNVALENVTDSEKVALQAQVKKMTEMEEALRAATEKAQAEARELTQRVYEQEALRQAEATKANNAVAELEKTMAGMDPEQLAIAKEQVAIMKSSKEDMVKRLDQDAKIIAANKKRNIELEIQVASLIEKKAKAEENAAKAMQEAISKAMEAQGDRVAALAEVFKNKQDEILKQTELLQKQLDEVVAENLAARETLKQLGDEQARTQEEKNKRIAALQGILYAKDLLTSANVKEELKKLLPDQITAIDKMNAAEIAKLAYNESIRVLADKQKLIGQLEEQMQTLAKQTKQMEVNTKRIVTLGSTATNLDAAKIVAQTEAAQAITDTTKEIEALEKDLATFEQKMVAEIAATNAKVSAASTETEQENAKAQERAFRESMAQKKSETIANIQNFVNKTNASFDNLAALIEKDIANLRMQEDTLRAAFEKLQDDLAKAGNSDADKSAASDDYNTKKAALDAKIATAIDQSGKLLADKTTFNKIQSTRTKQWEAAAKKLVDEQINSLRAQMLNQSETLKTETEKLVEVLRAQSRKELETVEAAQKESVRLMNVQFEANKKLQESQMASLQANIDNTIKDGQTRVADLEKKLQDADDTKRLIIQAEIDKAKNTSISLITKLQGEHKKTVDALQSKLDERTQMQKDYISELQSRKAWSEQALKVEIALLTKLAAGERAETQDKYNNLINSLNTDLAENLKKIQAEAALAVADLQSQIADQEKRAAAEQAQLAEQLAKQEVEYEKEMHAERTRIENLVGQERADAQKTFEKLKTDKEDFLTNLQSHLEDQIKKAEQAKAAAASAGELKVSMLEQQFADVEQLKMAVKVDEGEEILIQFPNDNKFLTATDSGQAILQEGIRFEQKFKFKVGKEERSKISIRTFDGARALTVADNKVSFEPLTVDDKGNKKANQQTQAFFLEGETEKAVLRVTDANNAKVAIIALDGKNNNLIVKKDGEDAMWLKKTTAGSGTFESLLGNLYADKSIESSERAIAMADVYFMSNRIFNQTDKLQDFSMALNEFIDSKEAANLLNESAAQKLGALMDKMDRFIIKEGDTSDTRGKVELDAEVLKSLRDAKKFLDPIMLKAGSIICIRKDQYYLSGQSQKNAAGKQVVKFTNGQLYNPTFALRVIPGKNANEYALETEDGTARLTYSDGNIAFAPTKENDPSQTFTIKGTRAAATITMADGFISAFKSTGSADLFFTHTTQAQIDAAKTQNTDISPASFQVDIFVPDTLDYDFIANGMPEYNADTPSKTAIGEITKVVRARLMDQTVSNTDKIEAVKKFEQYLTLYVNDASLLDWARAGQSLVEAAKQQLPSADPKIFEPILNSVKAFSVKNNDYLLLQNMYYAAAERQGINSFLLADAEKNQVISKAVEKFNQSALFKVVTRDASNVALVASNGSYLEAADQGIIISTTKAVDADQKPVEPSIKQLFKIVGSGTTVTIKLAQDQSNEDLGYVVVDSNNIFNYKNTEDSDNPLFKLSDAKAKFKVEVMHTDSLRYKLIAGDFNKMPGVFFEQMYNISESTVAEKDKTAQAKDILDTFVKMATEQIQGEASDKGGIKLKLRENMTGLQNIPDKEDEGMYPMGKALDFIKRYALYDKSFRKTGIKFDQADIDKFEMLEKIFPAPIDGDSAAPTRKISAANIKSITDPSGKGIAEDEYLSSLWKNTGDKLEGARILHAYLTKAANTIYAESFDDNSDLFGLSEIGEIKDGAKIYLAKGLDTPLLDANNAPIKDEKGSTLYNTTFLDAEGNALTKTINISTPAMLDDDGTEIAPAETILDPLTLGIVLALNQTKDPIFIMRTGQNLMLNPELDELQLQEIKSNLNDLVGSKKPIIQSFITAQDLIKSMVASLSGIKKAAGKKLTIAQKIDALLREAMKQYLTEEFKAADDLIKTFTRSKVKITPKERKAVNTTMWNDKDPLYIQFFNKEQLGIYSMVRKENKKKMALRKRAESKSKPVAKATQKTVVTTATPAK